MKKEPDFSKGWRGPIVSPRKGTTRITIRLDTRVLDWFRQKVDAAGGGNYQTLINDALKDYIHEKQVPLEALLRRVVRQELTARRGLIELGGSDPNASAPPRKRFPKS